jgi:hypothetical protein
VRGCRGLLYTIVCTPGRERREERGWRMEEEGGMRKEEGRGRREEESQFRAVYLQRVTASIAQYTHSRGERVEGGERRERGEGEEGGKGETLSLIPSILFLIPSSSFFLPSQ